MVSARISIGREYGGGGVACEGCVDVRQNDYPRDGIRCTPEPDGECLPIQRTSWRDFLGWEEFDLIHVGTHGWQECRPDGTCYTALATGRILSAADQFDLVRSYAGVPMPGVEYVRSGPSSVCEDAPADVSREQQSQGGGTDPYLDWVTDPDSEAYDLLCRNMLWEVVTDDFFYAVYPSGLEDKLIVLNACEAFKTPHLVTHLAAGGSTSIFGWKVAVGAVTGFRVMEHFYARLFPGALEGAAARGGGARAVVAWTEAVREHYRPVPPDTTERTRSIIRIPAPDSSSYVDKRPKELVYLLDPREDREMRDGGRLELMGVSGDGRPDSLRVTVEVHGLAEEPRLDEFRVGFRLDGQPLGATHALNRVLDEETHAFEGTVPLGRDTRPGERVDLDVRVEIPGGGISRWLYEDLLLLGGCSFAGVISERRIRQPRERLLAVLGEYHGRAVYAGEGRLFLSIYNRGDAPGYGTSEVIDLFMYQAGAAAEVGTLGVVPAQPGQLVLARSNPFHDPRRPAETGPRILEPSSFQVAIEENRVAGSFDLVAFDPTRMAGSFSLPLELAGNQFLFEAEFDAGLRCQIEH